MKINRNNYEEYFLLYADNELDAATKLAVESFMSLNADLSIELDMLMRTKSAPEEIIFSDKESLLKTEGNSINETNYEEYFLLYIDNELSAVKRAEIEMYVLQHPKLQVEFSGLKQAVILPETISYVDKKDLYRTEKRRIVFLKPWRLAAAAIFIGISAIGIWLMQKPASVNVVAKNQAQQHQLKTNDHSQTNAVAVKPVDTINHQLKQTEQTIAQQSVQSIQNKNADEKPVVKKKRLIIKDKQPEVAEQKASTQEKNKPADINVTEQKSIEQNSIVKQNDLPVIDNNNNVVVEQLPSKTKNITTAKQQPQEKIEPDNNYKVYNVAYKEINTNDDDNSLHVGGLDLNKTKVKNLFKKAKRLFSKQGKDEDDGKLKVANFQINTINQ